MAFTGSYPYALDSTLGVDFTKALAPSSTGDGLAQAQVPWELGTRIIGSQGSEWVLCQAGGTLSAGDVVIIQGDKESVTQWTCVRLSSTNGKSHLGALVGVVAAAAVSTNFVWVQRAGIAPNVNLSSTTPSTYALMHTSATAGQISTSSTGGTTAAVSGIVAENNAQINGGNPCWLASPTIGADD